MRFSPFRASALVCCFAAAACAPAIGSVGKVTDFTSKIPVTSKSWVLAAAPDGAIWVGETSTSGGSQATSRRPPRATRLSMREHGSNEPHLRVGRLSRDGSMRFFDIGQPLYSTPGGIGWAAGRIWLGVTRGNNTGVAAAISPAGDVDATVPLPGQGGGPVAAGPDGAPWMLVPGASAGLVRLNASTGAATPIPGTPAGRIPAPGAAGTALALSSGSMLYTTGDPTVIASVDAGGATSNVTLGGTVNPIDVAAGADGSVWWTPNGAGIGTVVRQAPGSSSRQSFAMPTGTTGEGIVIDASGVAWVLTGGNSIVRVDTSGATTTSITPAAGTGVVTGADGNVWVVSYPRGLFRVLTGVTPANAAAPTLSGRAVAGERLSVTTGEWKFLPSGYGYTWQRCKGASASACNDIPGATGTAYQASVDDEGGGIRVLVTATNLNGMSAPVSSNMATGDSPPARSSLTVGKPTRKGYVISTVVTAGAPGAVSQVGTVPVGSKPSEVENKRIPRAVRACAPKPITMKAARPRTIRCVLSPRVRSLLASRKQVVTLKTTFASRAGAKTTVTRRITVPRMPNSR